jgi:predicted phage terminase large subunit-like protein
MPYRHDFIAFAEKSFRTLTHGRAPQGSYLQYIAARLAPLCGGEPAKVIVNLPPRHFKTGICGAIVAAWEMAQRPRNMMLIISGSDRLGEQTLGQIKLIMRERWYQNGFDVRTTASNAEGLKTVQGGGVQLVSITGRFTGLGADLIVVDDPADIKDATNVPRLLEINGLFDMKVQSRLNNPATARMIVIAHRLSDQDLSGHLLRSDTDWQHIKLPLVAPEAECYRESGVVFRREKGELLRPGYCTEKELRSLQRQTVPVDYETLYQQNPPCRTFAQLDRACIPTHEGGVNYSLPLVISVDPSSSTSSRSSYSVIQAWVPFSGKHILVEQFRERTEFEELGRSLIRICKRLLPSVVLIEDNNNADGLAHRLKPSKFNVELVPVARKSKFQRLEPWVELIRSGHILLASSVDREAFIDELIQFPVGEFDDQVDAMTQYLQYVTMHALPPRRQRGIGTIRRSTWPF